VNDLPVTTTVRSGLTQDLPMVYAQVNDVVAYSNGVQFGLVENGVDLLRFAVTDPLKSPMVAGHHLDWFNGRLYNLVTGYDGIPGCALLASDSLNTAGGIESLDRLYTVVKQFQGTARVVGHVDAGLCVSDSRETWFLSGADAFDDNGFLDTVIAPYPVLAGMVRPIKGELLGLDGVRGNCLLLVTTQGVGLVLADGQFINLTQETISYPSGSTGTMMVREERGLVHLLFAILTDDQAYNAYGTAL
jgi:hypothetical protein